MRLEDLTRGISIKGILPNQHVVIVDVNRHSDDVVELVYKDASGNLGKNWFCEIVKLT